MYDNSQTKKPYYDLHCPNYSSSFSNYAVQIHCSTQYTWYSTVGPTSLFFPAHYEMFFWLSSKAAPNTAITPRSIVFVTTCLTERITLSHCFSFRAFACVQPTNEPRKESMRWQSLIAVFRSQCLVVRHEDQTASLLVETPLSGTAFLAYEWSVSARLYSKCSVYNMCYPKTFQTCSCRMRRAS